MKRTSLILMLLAGLNYASMGTGIVHAQVKVVACVGDSNTYGYNLGRDQAYPPQMEELLRDFHGQWIVHNFGVSGDTVLRQGDQPYNTTPALAANADIVIFAFGANATRSPNRGLIDEHFVSDYVALVRQFSQRTPAPKMWICLPLAAQSTSYTINPSLLENEVVPKVREVAAITGLPIIDLYSVFRASPQLYQADGIHPTPAGCALMAEIIAKTILRIPFVDDFEDGSVTDDMPVSLVPGGLPVSIDVNEGDVTLTDPLQLQGFSLGLTVVTRDGEPVYVAEASVQSVVRVSDLWTFAGIWTRGQDGPPAGDGGAYFCNIRGDGLITAGSFTGEQLTLETPLDPVAYDVILQLDTVGTNVIATAWPATEPWTKYSMTFVDSDARPAGTMGQSFGRGGDDATGAWATFRSLQVLEPTFVPFVPFVDDFADYSVDDDSPVSIVSGGLPSTIELRRGSMILSEPLQLQGFSLGLTNVMKDGRLIYSEDATAEAVVRVSDPFAFAGLFTRGQTDANGGDGGAYFGNIRGDGLVTTGSFTGQQLTLETPLDPTNSDVVLQVETVNNGLGGADVTTTAWSVEHPERIYSVTFVDTLARPAGFMGQSFGRGGDDATGAKATFRSFQVLEADAVETGEGL